MMPRYPIIHVALAVFTLILLCFYLSSCTKHPNPGAAFDKVNGAHTAQADDAVRRGEDVKDNWNFANPVHFPIIYFEFDSDAISLDYRDSLSNALQGNQTKWKCQVDGHASEEGTNEYNLALGEKRAYAVGSYISNFNGISTSETSYGEERPVSSVPEKNRRVEIKCK